MEETAVSLQPFFLWMAELSFSQWVLGETWAQPIAQVMHLVALAVFAGAVLVVDFRLLGVGFVNTSLPKVADEAMPWMIGAFVALFITGMPSLMSLALKQYYSPFFWWKMELVLVGIILTFTFRRWLIKTDEAKVGPVWPRMAGILSIAVWCGVAINARLIGLFS